MLGGLGLLWWGQVWAQPAGAAGIKRNWYHSILRLVKGGDGHYYLLRARDGHFWGFGREGQYRFELLRFGPDLKLKNKVKVRARNADLGLENAFEVLPAPDGIALLSVRRGEVSGKFELQRCVPRYDRSSVYCHCTRLADMPGFVPRLAQPDIRVAWSPDSSTIALTWRKQANQDRNDNATQCLLLDRKLEVIQGPFSPFPETTKPFRLLRTGLLSRNQLVFVVRAFQASGVFAAPASGAFHLVTYRVSDRNFREIRLDTSARKIMDIQLNFSDPQRIMAGGWWLNADPEKREAGVFLGELGSGDTLENLRLHQFEQNTHTEMLPRKLASGAVWFRPSYHNRLLATPEGYAYVLHVTGQLYPVIPVEHLGDKYDNALLSFFFDARGELLADNAIGFCNESRTDYHETGSWLPIQSDKGSFALVTDFSEIPSYAKSHWANSVLLPISLDPELALRKLRPGAETENLILAPRLYVRESREDYVFVGRTRKTYRLVRVKF